jgi:hypothetical protein
MKLYSYVGDVVDPFCGSGTTLRMAGSRPSGDGVDISPRYCAATTGRCVSSCLRGGVHKPIQLGQTGGGLSRTGPDDDEHAARACRNQ